ncbi:unnamed protein product [Caenorhabditis sp. 36 PRJEB53466]|nr:unnamed protein product [Caenorhabditis sp. 36 PRJEB53466]
MVRSFKKKTATTNMSKVSTPGDQPKAADQDFYQLLGVDKMASEAEIKSAYRKLALKYHPDRNPGDTHAQEEFKKVSIAYSVLSDPNKRRQYDVSGPSENQLDFEGFDVSEMGGVGRVFGALFTKLGVPIPTQIVPKVLAQARQICLGQECDVHAKPLPPGDAISSSVSKQHAHFYEIDMKEEFRKNGVAIICKSSSSKFKLVLFDKEGGVRMIQESGKRGKSGTQADMFFVPYTVANIQEFNPMKYHLEDKETPIAFHYLDSFEMQTATLLETRKHYIGVYGDNWISDVKYTIHFLPVAPEATEKLADIEQIEKSISAIKKEMLDFQRVFTEAKRQYDEAAAKLKMQDEIIQKTLVFREELYSDVIRQSQEPYNKKVSPSKTSSGFLGGWFK